MDAEDTRKTLANLMVQIYKTKNSSQANLFGTEPVKQSKFHKDCLIDQTKSISRSRSPL